MMTRRQKIEDRNKKRLLASFHAIGEWINSRIGKQVVVLALKGKEKSGALRTIPNRRIIFHGSSSIMIGKKLRDLASNSRVLNALLAMVTLSTQAVNVGKTFSQAQLRGTTARGRAILRDINITTGLNHNLLASNSILQERVVLKPAFIQAKFI